MRIVYLIDSICEIGGLQKVTVQKVNALAEVPDNEVWIILTDNTKPHPYKISDKVHIIDLSINYYEDDWKSNWHVLKGIIIKRTKHRRLLAGVLSSIHPDIVVSTGTSEKYLITRIKGEWACIREIHSVKDYRHLTANGLFQRISASIADFIDYKLTIKKYDKVVVLSKSDLENNWAGYDNVMVIPNPVTPITGIPSPLNSKKIAAVGRLVPIKGYSHLVRSFKIVADLFPDWVLDIWGEGPSQHSLREEIDENGLSGNILLRGPSNTIQHDLLSYSAFACTSLFDGFGLSILEAMSCGLPVVSYGCDYGPKEIIEDGTDGFLVSVGDEKGFAERLCQLIENFELRKIMGRAACEKSKIYNPERIVSMWMDLFEDQYRKKHPSLR